MARRNIHRLFSPAQDGNPVRTTVERDLPLIWDAIQADDELRNGARAAGYDYEKLKGVMTWQNKYACSWFLPSTDQICLSYDSLLARATRFIEYKSIAKRADIGSLQFTKASQDCGHQFLSTVLVHEVAHLVQWRFTEGTSYRKGERGRRGNRYGPQPHGATFKNVYSYLRRSVINPRPEVSQLVAA